MGGIAGAATGLGLTVAGKRGLAGENLRIIENVDLTFAAGEVVALAGPSGSGKSTLLYLLAGLLRPSAGEVQWGDVVLSQASEAERDRWRLKTAGFVFQSFNLIDELSPLDNVLAPGWFGGMGQKDLRQRGQDLLERFGVPLHDKRAALLSNGEKQRVAMARALLLEPKIVFADEPTASLDAENGERIAAVLRELSEMQGRTVIVASHDPAVLSRADRILRLDHGRLVQKQLSEAA